MAASIEVAEDVGASVDTYLLELRDMHDGPDRLLLIDSRINDEDSSRNAITPTA